MASQVREWLQKLGLPTSVVFSFRPAKQPHLSFYVPPFLSPHLTTYGVRCGERKGRSREKADGAGGRKGVTNFVPVTPPPFLRLINYKLIKLSHLYLPALILLFLSEKVEEEAKNGPAPPIFGYWVWAASLGKGSFVLRFKFG